MHIIAGKYRKRRLQSSPSAKVRPTARRLRETLFDFMAVRIAGARFLDLCAGSGAVGLEALSRGAAHATFVDCSPESCRFIRANLALCRVAETEADVVTSEAAPFLLDCDRQQNTVWDISYFDPPYDGDYETVMELFGRGVGIRREGGVLVVEHHCEKKLPEKIGPVRRWRVVRQGESCLSFYERKK